MRSDDPATQIFSSVADSVSLHMAIRSGVLACADGKGYGETTYPPVRSKRRAHFDREPSAAGNLTRTGRERTGARIIAVGP